jgi:hypothetical protein
MPKLFSHGNEANSNKLLKNLKISGIERLVLPFPDTVESRFKKDFGSDQNLS